MTRLAAAILLFAFLLFIAGCNPAAIEPQVEWGVSTCHRCGAVISERIWAAADRSGGAIRLYDDPGCLFQTRRREAAVTPDAVFHDHTGADVWLRGADAWFATTPATRSPRDFGWAAYASFAAAQDAVTAAGTGRIVRFAEAMQAVPDAP